MRWMHGVALLFALTFTLAFWGGLFYVFVVRAFLN